MGNATTDPTYGLVNLTKQLDLSYGQRQIALIQYAIEAIPTHFVYYSPADIQWLDHVLSSMLYPNPPIKLATLITAQDTQTYLDFHGQPLPGLRLAYDAGKAPIWKQHAPSTAKQRLVYIQHQLLPQLAKIAIEALADLTPEKALAMQPDTIVTLPSLAHTLIALDIQNEDESLDFVQRPNPRLDLFSDTCHDVLDLRIYMALQQINPH